MLLINDCTKGRYKDYVVLPNNTEERNLIAQRIPIGIYVISVDHA